MNIYQQLLIFAGFGISLVGFIGTFGARDSADVITEHVGLRALLMADAARVDSANKPLYDGTKKIEDFDINPSLINNLFANSTSCLENPEKLGGDCQNHAGCGGGLECITEASKCAITKKCALERCNAFEHLQQDHCAGDTCEGNAHEAKCVQYWTENAEFDNYFEADKISLEHHKHQMAWRVEFTVPTIKLTMISNTLLTKVTDEMPWGRTQEQEDADTLRCANEYKISEGATKGDCSLMLPNTAALTYPTVSVNLNQLHDNVVGTGKTDTERLLECDKHCGKKSEVMKRFYVDQDLHNDYKYVTHACRSLIPYCAETRLRQSDAEEQATPEESKLKYDGYFKGATTKKSFWVDSTAAFDDGNKCFGMLPPNTTGENKQITAVYSMWVLLLVFHSVLVGNVVYRANYQKNVPLDSLESKGQSVIFVVAIVIAIVIIGLNGVHLRHNRMLFHHKVTLPDNPVEDGTTHINYHTDYCFGRYIGDAMGYTVDGTWRLLKQGPYTEVDGIDNLWQKENDDRHTTHHLLRGPENTRRYQILDEGMRVLWSWVSLLLASVIAVAHTYVAKEQMSGDGRVAPAAYTQMQSSSLF